MRFLLSALGSAGDVHPFIAIAQQLVARGHAVTVLAAPPFRERIERADVRFAAFGGAGDYERLLAMPELWQPRQAARLILDELLERLPNAFETTARLTTPDTVLVGSTLSWAVRLLQEHRGLPAATVHLSPLCVMSADDPSAWPVVGDLRWLPRPARRGVQSTVDRLVLDRLIAPRLDAFRARLGLPRVTRVWSRWMHSPDLVIAAWPAWFAPRQPDWPRQMITTGFPRFAESAGSLDDGLSGFIADGPSPIGITPGSAMAHGALFIDRALAACAAHGRRAVIVTPFREHLPELPPWAHHVDYAPFTTLLPRLSALIHHGGIGTAAQAIAAALPQLIAPFAHDQFDNAARLVRSGLARSVTVQSPAARWAAALGSLMSHAGVASGARARQAEAADERPAAETIAMRLEALHAPRRSSGSVNGDNEA